MTDGCVGGIVSVTTSTPEKRDHIRDSSGSARPTRGAGNVYERNIQVADLNALNAALAVIRWKRLRGFYNDLKREHHTLYAIDGNHLLNEDRE